MARDVSTCPERLQCSWQKSPISTSSEKNIDGIKWRGEDYALSFVGVQFEPVDDHPGSFLRNAGLYDIPLRS